jgi:hypothetical protein
MKRTFELGWERSRRDQHLQARSPFFFRQNPDSARLFGGVEYEYSQSQEVTI